MNNKYMKMEQSEKSDILHSNLVRVVSDMYGSRTVKDTARKEVSPDISEYGMPPSAAMHLSHNLCRSLPYSRDDKSKERKLYSHLCKTRTLAAFEHSPLTRHISRDISFIKLKRTLNHWNTTVHCMRNKEQLIFPLDTGTHLTKCNGRVCKPLKKQQTIALNEIPFADKSSEHKFNMTELIELQKEKAKFNARYSYMLAKAARHRKIKSKKYHRMLKPKQTECLESIAVLQKSNPIKAGQLLEFCEKQRAKERATLRHSGTGHWARQFKTSKKQNSEIKQLIQQELLKCKLNEKLQVIDSSEDEVDEEELSNKQTDVNNPWITNAVILEGEAANVSGESELRSLSDKQDAPVYCERAQFGMSPEKSNRRNNIPKDSLDTLSKNKLPVQAFSFQQPKSNQTVNPNSFIGMTSSLFQKKDTHLQEADTIAEAFANDDLITEFKKESACISKKSQLVNIDSSLPGWGNWSGKRTHADIRCNKVTLAKYINKKGIILTEDKADKLKEQQVSEIPFSFTRMKDYEASIRFPVGSTWAPHTAHNKLVSPSVITKLGTVIKPIQEDIL